MNKDEIISYFHRLDKELATPSILHIYGSAAVILLGSEDRTSLDIDVAGPYSTVDEARFAEASANAGLPVNPVSDFSSNHVEWIGPLRLCLPPPVSGTLPLTLWRGANLVVQTGNVEDLVASKLIRYDETDQADIHFLYQTSRFMFESVSSAVKTLPRPFCEDTLVMENLANLKLDMAIWKGMT